MWDEMKGRSRMKLDAMEYEYLRMFQQGQCPYCGSKKMISDQFILPDYIEQWHCCKCRKYFRVRYAPECVLEVMEEAR